MKTRNALAFHLLKGLRRPVSLRYVPGCERAIQNMERDRAGEEVRLYDGLVRTSGEILRMFDLYGFVDWVKASWENVPARLNKRAVGRA